ncbi:MAG: paraquat-inducible protein A [Bacteroidota bacterium]
MKFLRATIITLLLLSSVWASISIYQSSLQARMLKEDQIALSKVKYGLFNVDEWKNLLTNILSKKIDEININEDNQDEMREKISTFLYAAIKEFEVNFKRKNSKEALFGLSFKNGVARTTGIFKRIKEEVPNLTEQTINFINDPENKRRIKLYLTEKLNEYADKTFAEVSYEERDSILSKYNSETITACLQNIELMLVQQKDENQQSIYLLIIFLLFLFAGLLLLKNPTQYEFSVYIASTLVLLIMGLLLPMIDIDARISEVSFSLLGEKITFTDQVLFYKSKSILEVVSIMMSQGKIKLLLVGFLVLLFSVLFPLAKIICTYLIVFNPAFAKYSAVDFMAFKSGKWSMADVMVVAIFMSYLGFSGILTDQLRQLESISDRVDILTTNYSTLQPGFYLFLTFVVFSLLITTKIAYRIDQKVSKSSSDSSKELIKHQHSMTIARRMSQKGFDRKVIEEITGVQIDTKN